MKLVLDVVYQCNKRNIGMVKRSDMMQHGGPKKARKRAIALDKMNEQFPCHFVQPNRLNDYNEK